MISWQEQFGGGRFQWQWKEVGLVHVSELKLAHAAGDWWHFRSTDSYISLHTPLVCRTYPDPMRLLRVLRPHCFLHFLGSTPTLPLCPSCACDNTLNNELQTIGRLYHHLCGSSDLAPLMELPGCFPGAVTALRFALIFSFQGGQAFWKLCGRLRHICLSVVFFFIRQ